MMSPLALATWVTAPLNLDPIAYSFYRIGKGQLAIVDRLQVPAAVDENVAAVSCRHRAADGVPVDLDRLALRIFVGGAVQRFFKLFLQ